MRAGLRLSTVLLLIVSSGILVAQSADFVGVWEIGKNPATGRANITLDIQRSDESLGGTMIFVNPDGSLLNAVIEKAAIAGPMLSFETMLGNEPFYWSLTLSRSGQSAVLKGNQREMLVEEKATKKK
jgi:hypothetical protein